MTLEYRHIAGDESETRAADDGMTLTGYAAKYDSKSEDMGFRETIEPGAFTRSLKSRNDIKAYVNHNSDMVIGSTRAGTLELSVNDIGLADVIHLPETTYARDLSVVVARKDVTGQSFGFTVVRDEWSDDYKQRRLIEVRLHEVSIVSNPAYRSTTVSARALARLAFRADQDAETLADAMTALESGSDLTEDQVSVLLETVERIRPTIEAPPPDVAAPLSILSAKLDLLELDLAL